MATYVPKPNIAELADDRVRFVDGSSEAIDAIIYCTGYKVTFPFFDENFVSAPDNDLPLYLRMFKPEIDNLFFIGLMQPLGAIFPIAERQACLAGEYLCGRYALPSAAAMQQRSKPSARQCSPVCEIEATYDAGRFRRVHGKTEARDANRRCAVRQPPVIGRQLRREPRDAVPAIAAVPWPLALMRRTALSAAEGTKGLEGPAQATSRQYFA